MGIIGKLLFGGFQGPEQTRSTPAPPVSNKPNAGRQPNTPRANRADFDPSNPRATTEYPGINISQPDTALPGGINISSPPKYGS